jgi:hypothetical protein
MHNARAFISARIRVLEAAQFLGARLPQVDRSPISDVTFQRDSIHSFTARLLYFHHRSHAHFTIHIGPNR